MMFSIHLIIWIPLSFTYFTVNGEGQYARCEYAQPFCPYSDENGQTIRENCNGICRQWDYYNLGGNVSFCCEFNHGRYIQPGEQHCCDYFEACHDNYDYEDDCSNWYYHIISSSRLSTA